MQGVCELTFLNRQPNSNKFRRLNLQKTKAFTEKAYRDLENKGLYVYYGQEDGYYLQYPAMKYGDNDDCYIFDPRTRYAYSESFVSSTNYSNEHWQSVEKS